MVFVRPDSVVAIPALENLIVRISIVALMFVEAVAVQGFGANGRGEGFCFEGLLGLVVRGHFNRFLRSRDEHLEEEV